MIRGKPDYLSKGNVAGLFTFDFERQLQALLAATRPNPPFIEFLELSR